MRSRMNDTVAIREVHDRAAGILQDALQWVDQGYKCTVTTLFCVLFFAASRMASIFDACQRLSRCPTGQTLRACLAGQLPPMKELERRLNRALAAKLPRSLFAKRRPMALDISQIGYYGKPGPGDRELCRGKRKQGTSRFHCYATLCVIRRGERYTVAMTYVWKDDSNARIVQRLLEQARSIGLRPRRLLLDRGFYGIEVVKYLQSVRCPFLMPVVHRGRRPKKLHAALKGTRRFLTFKRNGFSRHEMINRKEQVSVKIAVVCRAGKRPMVFAFWGFTAPSAIGVARDYRTRYGIESSYRQMNQGRIRTCSTDVRLRLLFVGIALVLRNLWVWLHHTVLGRIRGGSVQPRLELLRLRTMLLMLQRFAEAALGCVEHVPEPSRCLNRRTVKQICNY